MSSKTYFWLKLKDDFFDEIEIKRLRRMAGGDTYTIIYLKMLLLSLKEEGNLFFNGVGDDFIDELSLDIDEDLDNVKMTIAYLKSKGLLEIISDQKYHLNALPEMVGKETDSARRMRRKRQRDSNKSLETSQSDKLVTGSDTEIEKELELEKELETEKDKYVVDELDIDYSEIVEYLNLKTGKQYRATTKKTQALIKARVNEGFTVDDFKKVIDKKVKDNQAGYFKDLYLRPETLFGNKFEGYLNQNESLGKQKGGLLPNEQAGAESNVEQNEFRIKGS